MQINIVGSGRMARALAARAATGDHQIRVTNPNLDSARALLADTTQRFPAADIQVAETVSPSDLTVLAVPYPVGPQIVSQLRDDLAGQVVVDISNPVNRETFDALEVPPGTSAAEQIQDAAGTEIPVVKAFNTIFSDLLEVGESGGEQLDVLIAGDDPAAKTTVARFASSTGMRPLDVGPLRRARELEAFEFLHLTMQQPLGLNHQSAIKIVT